MSIHPIVQIESKTLSSIKNSSVLKFLDKYKIKVLANQNHKEQIPNFQDIINNMQYSVFKVPNNPWELRFIYRESRGTTKIKLYNRYDSNKPTLIFHHGLGGKDNLHLKIFINDTFSDKFNVFSIKAANHESTKAVIKNCVNTFSNLATTTCASVIAINQVCDFHKNNSTTPIVIVGLSMGGMITALHYYTFDSGSYYFPIVSYPNFGKVLLSTKVKGFIYNYDKIRKNKSIRDCFEIPKNLKNKSKNKIFPVLSKYDELIDFRDAINFWKGYQVLIYDTGHHSILLKMKEIRQYILEKTRL